MMNRQEFMTLTFYAILVIVNTYAISQVTYNSYKQCKYCEACVDISESAQRYAMYNESLEPDVRLNGVYHTPNFYCVWTKDRPVSEIVADDISLGFSTVNTTAVHELCHHLVYLEKEHFCGEFT